MLIVADPITHKSHFWQKEKKLTCFLSFRYLLTRYAESLGQFAAASQACNFSLRFFHSNQKDVSLCPIFARVNLQNIQVIYNQTFLLVYAAVHCLTFPRPQSTSSRHTNMELLRRSQSLLLSGTG